jgi:hypothetical protein
MKSWIWELAGFVVIVAVIFCTITFADKREAKEVILPAAVKDAVKVAYPQGEIEKVKAEREFEVFELLLKQNGQEIEPTITPEGIITGVETKVGKEILPDIVAKALSKEAQGAEIKSIDQEIKYYVIKPVKLDVPETNFEAKLVKDGKVCEIKLSASGTVFERSAWKNPRSKDEYKCGDNEENDEQEVSIDQVPPAVKAAILKEAGSGTVKEIEQKTKDGKAIYGADIIIDGKKFEIKVSADGKIIDKQEDNESD